MIVPRSWREAFESLFLVLFPARCAGCGESLPHKPKFGLCDPCFEILEPNLGARCPVCDEPGHTTACPRCQARPSGFSNLRAPFLYGGPLKELLLAAKFKGREDLALAAGHLLNTDTEAKSLSARATVCVPIPLGAKRRRQRGYNQAGLMAKAVSRETGIPVQHLLQRVRDTAEQSGRSLAERAANVADCFRAKQPVSGCVLLVDDVATSCETLNAASRTLLSAGAREVVALTAARAVPET